MTGFYASEAFRREKVSSAMRKLKNEFAAFLGVAETDQRTLPARTLDKRLDECLLMYIHGR